MGNVSSRNPSNIIHLHSIDPSRSSVSSANASAFPFLSPEYWKNSNKSNVCTQCGYVARDKTNLRKHMYTHTGEKPYACQHCNYKTTQSSNLHTHVRRHHPQYAAPPVTFAGDVLTGLSSVYQEQNWSDSNDSLERRRNDSVYNTQSLPSRKFSNSPEHSVDCEASDVTREIERANNKDDQT